MAENDEAVELRFSTLQRGPDGVVIFRETIGEGEAAVALNYNFYGDLLRAVDKVGMEELRKLLVLLGRTDISKFSFRADPLPIIFTITPKEKR